jgi:cytosine/adenosine deaminase-related metal-dependent hydrolase
VPNIIDESYSRFDILLHEGKISSMDPPRSLHDHGDDLAIDEIIDCSDKMLLSGFVNAHAHSNEHWSRGLIRPLPLEMWILQLIRHEPRGAEGWHGDKSFEETPAWAVGMSALHTGVECLLSGVSAIMDHLFVRHLEDVAEAVKAYKALGIRAYIAPMLNDDKEMYGNYIPLVHDASKRNACLDCACSGREVFLPDGGMAQDGSFRTAPGDYDPVKTKAALQLWEDGKL